MDSAVIVGRKPSLRTALLAFSLQAIFAAAGFSFQVAYDMHNGINWVGLSLGFGAVITAAANFKALSLEHSDKHARWYLFSGILLWMFSLMPLVWTFAFFHQVYAYKRTESIKAYAAFILKVLIVTIPVYIGAHTLMLMLW